MYSVKLNTETEMADGYRTYTEMEGGLIHGLNAHYEVDDEHIVGAHPRSLVISGWPDYSQNCLVFNRSFMNKARFACVPNTPSFWPPVTTVTNFEEFNGYMGPFVRVCV